MLLENKGGVIYGAGSVNRGAIARAMTATEVNISFVALMDGA